MVDLDQRNAVAAGQENLEIVRYPPGSQPGYPGGEGQVARQVPRHTDDPRRIGVDQDHVIGAGPRLQPGIEPSIGLRGARGPRTRGLPPGGEPGKEDRAQDGEVRPAGQAAQTERRQQQAAGKADTA
jgi:hypothetical protein